MWVFRFGSHTLLYMMKSLFQIALFKNNKGNSREVEKKNQQHIKRNIYPHLRHQIKLDRKRNELPNPWKKMFLHFLKPKTWSYVTIGRLKKMVTLRTQYWKQKFYCFFYWTRQAKWQVIQESTKFVRIFDQQQQQSFDFDFFHWFFWKIRNQLIFHRKSFK